MNRRLPFGVPGNYRDLASCYGAVLALTATGLGISVEELVASARCAKLVELFDIEEHFPSRFTWDEAKAVAGMNDDQWHKFLVYTKKAASGLALPYANIRPYTLKGGEGPGPAEPWDMEAVYWGSDILRVLDFMDTHKIRRHKPTCSALVSAFKLHLEEFLDSVRRIKIAAATKAVDASLAALEAVDDGWPEDLPRNNNELVKMYNEYVFDQVRRVSKIKTDDELEEVGQQVWLNLIHSKVLEKFIEAAKTKLPRTLTLKEVCGYLGITSQQWASAVAYSEKTDSFWMPIPVKGTAVSVDALYLTEDIQTLDNSGFLDGRRNAEREHPEFSGRGFKSYLTMAVKNHFKNLLRTRSRRHKERGVDSKVVLSPNTAGTYHKAYTSEEDVSWEENLADGNDLPMEDLLDLKDALDRNGVDPTTDDGVDILDHMTRGLTLKAAVTYHGRQQGRAVQRIQMVG
jgi:hypothetical protein